MPRPAVQALRFVPCPFSFGRMREPKTLSQYPWVVVRLDCRLCQRRGCYRLARLAARYGPEMPLEKLLAILASDCPWWRSEADRRKYDLCCSARFVDLDHNLPPQDLPPDLLPGPPIHRERPPTREEASKPPRNRARNTIYRLPMLADQPDAMPIVIVCRRCDRRQVFA